MSRVYRATKSRSQGRKSWCIMFRHPLKLDGQGKPGLRVRRGLGTTDEDEAEELISQMNRLLSDEIWWSLVSKERASATFDERIVSAFYDDLDPTQKADPWAIRDRIIPLPDENDGYAKIMLLGTTGAGKTTLVRQLIGSDPDIDRFPSTSAAKTTICDMECILRNGNEYEAVVTFFTADKVRIYIQECTVNAGKSYINGDPEQDVVRYFLEHTDQRFRLSYILGTLNKENKSKLTGSSLFGNLRNRNDDKADREEKSYSLSSEERQELTLKLESYLERVKNLSSDIWAKVQTLLEVDASIADEEDKVALEELFEEELMESEMFQELVEDIFDEVEKRFSYVKEGTWNWNQGWPESWTFKSDNRQLFVREIRQMTSNYHLYFGKLLTPLVQGIRIVGPFGPTWLDGEQPKLVLMDGEGLLHQGDANLSTKITKRIQYANALLLVDNAAQPMLTPPATVLRYLASSGFASKLHICFTHFDLVNGDNLYSIEDKANHVLGSLENVIADLAQDIGSIASKSLKRHIKEKIFFVGGIHKSIHIDEEELDFDSQITIEQLNKMVNALQDSIVPPEPLSTVPIYDSATLVLSIQNAAEKFHLKWDAILGIRAHSKIRKQHWTRIKALSRRLAILREDEYQELKPVSDLITFLRESLYIFISDPYYWEPEGASDELKADAIEVVAQELSKRLHDFASERLWENQLREWIEAYQESRSGSTFRRANDIKQINNKAIPSSVSGSSKEITAFLGSCFRIVLEAVEAAGGKVNNSLTSNDNSSEAS